MDLLDQAAALLTTAYRSHVRLAGLPPDLQPRTLEDAHAIQSRIVARLGETVGGWKAGIARPIRAPVLASRLFSSPVSISAGHMLRRVVEGEVAFYFHTELPPAARDYSREEIAAHVWACTAIEVVDSRYLDQASLPELDRVADLFGNSALVYGAPVADWQKLGLADIQVTLAIDGRTIIARKGGHASGDPLGACVVLANGLRGTIGIKAGQVVTAGTYTGAPVMAVGSTALVTFKGLGSASVTFGP